MLYASYNDTGHVPVDMILCIIILLTGSNTFTHQTTSSVSVTPSISSNSKETQGNDSAVGIAVGVVVVLIVLSIAVIVVITILIVLKFKNQKLLHSALVNSDVGLNNQTYQSDVINTDRKKGIHGNLSNPIYEGKMHGHHLKLCLTVSNMCMGCLGSYSCPRLACTDVFISL